MYSPASETSELPEMIETRLISLSKNQLREGIGDLDGLMESIRASGLLCPVTVRPSGSGFEVIAGNRRAEACKRLRMALIPSIVRIMDDKEAYELSIAENIERMSLSIIEEATAFKKYVDDFGWGSVSELADKIGKSPAYISHHISLLKLPQMILNKLAMGEISPSVAAEFVWVKDKLTAAQLGELASTKELTVRQIRAVKRKKKSIDSVDADDPFPKDWIRSKSSEEKVLIGKGVVALRIAMVRIDSLIERTKDEDTRKFLLQMRFGVHKIIDETLVNRKQSGRF